MLIWHPESLNSLNPVTGDVYWTIPLKPAYRMSITAPRKSGSLLFASGIGEIGALIKLDDDKPAAEVVWRGKARNAIYSCNATPIIDDGEPVARRARVAVVLAGWKALAGLPDFLTIAGLSTWVESVEELEALFPGYDGLKRRLSRWIRIVV